MSSENSVLFRTVKIQACLEYKIHMGNCENGRLWYQMA